MDIGATENKNGNQNQ